MWITMELGNIKRILCLSTKSQLLYPTHKLLTFLKLYILHHSLVTISFNTEFLNASGRIKYEMNSPPEQRIIREFEVLSKINVFDYILEIRTPSLEKVM